MPGQDTTLVKPPGCLSTDTVLLLVSGALGPEARAEITAHIEACDDCCAVVAQAVRVRRVGDAAPQASSSSIASPGTRIAGRYVVQRLVGRGAMGDVYAAQDTKLDRAVALKLLAPGLSELHPGTAERFVRESKTMARLRHPNVVTVHDADTWQGRPWVAMELVDGATMRTWAGTHDWSAVLAAYRDVALGLAEAHRAGVIHRDVKPDNILVDSRGRAQLTDFGLAKPVGGESTAEWVDVVAAREDDPTLTLPGALVGTPAYMAPEQWRGEEADARSDLFSLCASLYEGLFGVRPFQGRTPAALGEARLQGRITAPPAGRRVPPWVRRVVARGLAPDPAARWSGPSELVAAIDAGHRTRRRIGSLSALGLAAALGLGLGAWRSASVSADADGAWACPDLQGEVVSWWDEAERATLAERFGGDDVPATLEAWLSEIEEARQAACETVEAASAIACLRGQLGAARTVVEALRHGEPDITRALAALEGLPRPQRCTGDAQLSTRVPEPAAPGLRPRIATLRTELLRIEGLRLSGDAAGARAALDAIMPEIERLAFRPVVAEAALARARIELEAGDLAAARAGALAAIHEADAAHHDHAVVEIATFLVETASEQGEHAQALEYADRATAAMQRLGGQWPELEAPLLLARGTLAHRTGRYADALLHFQQATPLLEGHVDRFAAMSGKAAASSQLGDISGAVAIYEAMERDVADTLGPHHPRMIEVLADRAGTHLNVGRWQDAEPVLERALEIADARLPATHRRTGQLVHMRGSIRQMAGEQDAALADFRRAREIFEAAYGPVHVRVAMAHEGEAMALGALGRSDEALASMHEAYAMVREIFGDTHSRVGTSATNLVALLLHAGRFDEALDPARTAVAVQVQNLGEEHVLTARARTKLGDTLLQAGRIDDARVELERALDVFGRVQDDPRYTAIAEFKLAQVLLRRGDPTRARTLAASALERIESADPGDAGGLAAMIREWTKSESF
jgi:tetratricopeptide (TPR) repeat protein